jgi:hypothetical protein
MFVSSKKQSGTWKPRTCTPKKYSKQIKNLETIDQRLESQAIWEHS